jgi:hypothetical protein
VLDDAAATGIRDAIVLASGGDGGEAGRAAEASLVRRAVGPGITLLGPDCVEVPCSCLHGACARARSADRPPRRTPVGTPAGGAG